MARAFKRRGDTFVARMDKLERGVVAGLMEQTRALLAPPERAPTGDAFEDLVAGLGDAPGSGDEHPQVPGWGAARDPALERLLPTAHRGDDEVAAEFRRLTEHDLRERKATHLAVAIEALGAADGQQVVLSRAQAESMLVALTDTRLLLGERLGLRTDEDAQRLTQRLGGADADSPFAYAASSYDFLTWLQESLTQAVLGRGGRLG